MRKQDDNRWGREAERLLGSREEKNEAQKLSLGVGHEEADIKCRLVEHESIEPSPEKEGTILYEDDSTLRDMVFAHDAFVQF